MAEWLIDIAKHLKRIDVNSSTDSGRRMCVVLLIIVLLFKIQKFQDLINFDYITLLFSMLHIMRPPERPGVQQVPNFLDLAVIMARVPEDKLIQVSNALLFFNRQILPISSDRLDWVYIIPLIHIFSKKVKISEKRTLLYNEIEWKDENLQLFRINSHTRSCFTRYITYT